MLPSSFLTANQIIGWTYDAAGNLLSDGTGTYTYDALNCLVQHSDIAYVSNGDGILLRLQRRRHPRASRRHAL